MASHVSLPVVDRILPLYSRCRLLALSHTAGTKLCSGARELSAAGLLRYRGWRAGVQSRDRSVFINKHKSLILVFRCASRHHHLATSFDLHHINQNAVIRTVIVGSLNVRTLGNKLAVVSQTIIENKLDLFAVIESWHDSADSPSVVASTPPGCRVLERARSRTGKASTSLKTNHGGICIFIRS